jgi:hypothetical protein
MRNARRLIIAGCTIAGLPALVRFILSTSGLLEGGHGASAIIPPQATGLWMAVSAVILVIGVSRALASVAASPVARTPLNVATSAIGIVALLAIILLGWRELIG